MTPPAHMETCQNCDSSVPVDDHGRVAWHTIAGEVTEHIGMLGWCGCWRSRHPSREELARRKAARTAKRAALVAELRPEAAAALDAYLECRPEYADRIGEFKRAALYEFNRANKTHHRTLYTVWTQIDVEARPDYRTQRCARCRICGAKIGSLVLGMLSLPARGHLAQCAPEYLAGLRPAAPASVEAER